LRWIENISWTDRVGYEETLQRNTEEKNILQTINRRKVNWTGHVLRRNCLLNHVIEGNIERKMTDWKKRKKMSKNPTRCNSTLIFIYCNITLHVSCVTPPIIRSTVQPPVQVLPSNVASWPRWREAVITLFSTPDDGCCDTRNM